MKFKKVKLCAFLLLGIGLTSIEAQEAITAAGGNASGSGGSVSYSVGQVVYTSSTGTNGSVAQGVQQPYEISVVTGIEEAIGINLMVSAYPNPTTDFLNLKVDASTTLSIQSMSYQLFDISGKLLENKKLTGNETQIDLNGFISSTYFVKVLENNQLIKNFKIVKN